ncbi:MAG: hypothetical protein JST64_00540 [Actinobacteria bacterium]|nr:hypothetical protein [Actinomycetota bacterium]
MKRILAILAALAMIGAAALIRQQMIDGDTTSGGDGTLRLRCGSELASVCERLAKEDGSIEVTVRDDGETTDALSTKAAIVDFDAWLSVGPWAGIVADNRRQAALTTAVLAAPSRVLARSPVTFVGPADRIAALISHCGGTITWTCIGDASGRPWSELGGQPTWGPMKGGLAPPDTGSGLVALDQAVATQSSTTDWGTADLEQWSGWLAQLLTQAQQSDDPLARMLVQSGWASITAPLERQSGPEMERGNRRASYSLLYPEPMVTADVTLVPANGLKADDLLDRLGSGRIAAALTQAGWRVVGQPNQKGVGGGPTLPPTSNLASPGALQALRNEWKAIRR